MKRLFQFPDLTVLLVVLDQLQINILPFREDKNVTVHQLEERLLGFL